MESPLLLSVATLLVVFIGSKFLKRFLVKIANKKNVQPKRLFYIEKVFHFLIFIVTVMILLVIWSIDIKGLSVFASSVFAVIGVALFAQWSILSNVTSSLIIFFTFPATVGDKIRIIDNEESVEGTIKEITLFRVELRDDDNNAIYYPNSLLLQKPIRKIS